MTSVTSPRRRTDRNERGFTLAELLVATTISMVVVGGAVALTSQIQNGYRRQVEDAVAMQEGRFALEWIGRLVRGAGNNPFSKATTVCPSDPTAVEAIRIDPDDDGVDNDIRLQSDTNPPDGLIGGPNATGACDQANEDVTISFDAANNVIVFLDNNLGGAASTRTDRVIQDLHFVYRDTNHDITAVAANIAFVEIQITVRTRTLDPATNAPVTRTLSSEIRVRARLI